MNIKRFLTLILALTLVFALASCKKCDGHVDADDDYKCDKCGEDYDDGDEAPDVTTVTVSFTVKLDNGQALSGVSFTLERGERFYNLTSDANGLASVSVEPGAYAISYDYDTLPEYCTPETFGIKIAEGTNSFNLLIVDNQPDGSAQKPFFISENETELTLSPGQEVFFNYRGSSLKYARVYSDAVVINYGDNTYEAVNGLVEAVIEPDIGTVTVFSVKNISDAELNTTLYLEAPLGSSENPIKMDTNSLTATVNDETIIYYKWTADKDGVLVLTSPTERNNISLTKILENDVPVSSYTSGSSAAYLVVSVGDTVTVAVSAFAPDKDSVNQNKDIEVSLSLKVYAGTHADPVPVLKDEISLSLNANSEIVFRGETGKTLKITDESYVSVWHDTITYTNSEGNEISVTLCKPIFVLENKNEKINGITLIFN